MAEEFTADRARIGALLADDLPLLLRALQLWLVQLQKVIESLEGADLDEEKKRRLEVHEAERTRVLDLVASISASVTGKPKADLTREDVAAVRRFIAQAWD